MKIRISSNSIRFRLKQAEVHKFSEEKIIKEVTAFGPSTTDQLTFILKEGNSPAFDITFQTGTVTLSVPPSVCRDWTASELVGFEERINSIKGETINILVEKDFACLDATPIENEDTYPNPNIIC